MVTVKIAKLLSLPVVWPNVGLKRIARATTNFEENTFLVSFFQAFKWIQILNYEKRDVADCERKSQQSYG